MQLSNHQMVSLIQFITDNKLSFPFKFNYNFENKKSKYLLFFAAVRHFKQIEPECK